MPIDYKLTPNLMKTSTRKFSESHYAGAKFYRAQFIQGRAVLLSRKQFRRASEAAQYGPAVVERLRRLQAAAELAGAR